MSTTHSIAAAPFELVVKRYAKSYRRRLRKLARGSSRLGDLVRSFPAAAFALVSNRGPAEGRGRAVALVKAGAPLAAVADALALPLWTRRLPPEAFDGPFGPLAAGPEFARRAPNAIPDDPAAAAMWLEWVSAALALGDERFALWLAGQKRLYLPRGLGGPQAGETAPVELLAAFAWYSQEGAGQTGANFIRRRWRSTLPFGGAAAEAHAWLLRLLHGYCAERLKADGGWFKAVSVSGLRIEPLISRDALIAEGERMDNCLSTYAESVLQGRCLIYAVRRGNRSVASLEIGPCARGKNGVRIAQLAGPSNEPADEAVWRAVAKWMAQRRGAPLSTSGGDLADAVDLIDRARWMALWAPYVAAQDGRLQPLGKALFPGAPGAAALRTLSRAMARLARIGARL